MGQPKQLLNYQGMSLLRRAATAAVKAKLDSIIVVLGADANRMEEELTNLPVRTVTNHDWQLGMGTSIRTGMSAVCNADAVILMLCDQPFVSANTLRSLIEAHHMHGVSIAACAYGNTLGVPALFAKPHFPKLANLPDDAGAKQVILAAGESVRAVPFPQGACDIDTPAQFANLQSPPRDH